MCFLKRARFIGVFLALVVGGSAFANTKEINIHNRTSEYFMLATDTMNNINMECSHNFGLLRPNTVATCTMRQSNSTGAFGLETGVHIFVDGGAERIGVARSYYKVNGQPLRLEMPLASERYEGGYDWRDTPNVVDFAISYR